MVYSRKRSLFPANKARKEVKVKLVTDEGELTGWLSIQRSKKIGHPPGSGGPVLVWLLLGYQ